MAAQDSKAAVEAGDACLAHADLKCAIEAYYAVVVRGAPGPWVPHALYQQGRAFSMAGDLPDTRLAWSKLVREYPQSPEAALARRGLAGEPAPPPPRWEGSGLTATASPRPGERRPVGAQDVVEPLPYQKDREEKAERSNTATEPPDPRRQALLASALTFGRQQYRCGEVSSYIGEGGQGVTRGFDRPPDVVSQAVVRVLQRRGIPVQAASGRGLISTGDVPLGKSINSWLQCLGRFNELTGTATGENYDRTFLQLLISVSADGPQSSSVIATAALRGERDVNPGAGLMIPHGNDRIVAKPSNGLVEAELFLLLEEELRAMPAPRPEPATRSVSGSTSRSTIDRLRELEQMRKEGLITESEFKAKRRTLIEEH